jgi:glucose-1-phosphate thymidylyltransferase
VLGVYDVGDLEAIKKYNAIELGSDGSINFFEEKPQSPQSTLTGIALYYYPASVVALIGEYLRAGHNPDQPGRFVQWLYPQQPVYTWQVPGRWLDVGSHETLAEAQQVFAGTSVGS